MQQYKNAKGGVPEGGADHTFDNVNSSVRLQLDGLEEMQKLVRDQKPMRLLDVDSLVLEPAVKTEGEKEDSRLLQLGTRSTSGTGGGKTFKGIGVASALQHREAWLAYLRASGQISEVNAINYRAFPGKPQSWISS